MARIRGEVPERFEGYPAMGAFHEVIPNSELRTFLTGFCSIADDVFTRAFKSVEIDPAPHKQSDGDYDPITVVFIDNDGNEYNSLDFYRSYYATSMWISVLDGHRSEQYARAIRTIWEKQDLGDTQQKARNQIDRHMPDEQPCLKLDQLVRVGRRLPSAPSSHEGRKLALVPCPSECGSTQELLSIEHTIIIEAINSRMKGKRKKHELKPSEDYIPHMTFAWFKDCVEEDQIAEIAEKTKTLAASRPLHIELERQISFRDRLIR